MRKFFLVLAMVLAVVITLVMAARLSCRPAPGEEAVNCPPLAERRLMSRWQRLRLMEHLGKVPDDGDGTDFDYAKRTRWWGKRLNRKAFWKDKVIWHDKVARFEAARRGRECPPIPYDAPEFDRFSDRDYRRVEWKTGMRTGFVVSERERVFWNTFDRTHPKPPEIIEIWQTHAAEMWMYSKSESERKPPEYSPAELKHKLERDIRDANEDNLPPECVSEEAYRWAYIMEKREEYEKELKLWAGFDRVSPREITKFLDHLSVDRKYITEPLSADDIRAANAWKVAYLRRLRQEKTDETYINAYLKAWSLSSNEVFGAPEQTNSE